MKHSEVQAELAELREKIIAGERDLADAKAALDIYRRGESVLKRKIHSEHMRRVKQRSSGGKDRAEESFLLRVEFGLKFRAPDLERMEHARATGNVDFFFRLMKAVEKSKRPSTMPQFTPVQRALVRNWWKANPDIKALILKRLKTKGIKNPTVTGLRMLTLNHQDRAVVLADYFIATGQPELAKQATHAVVARTVQPDRFNLPIG